jgi:hypothetical protein
MSLCSVPWLLSHFCVIFSRFCSTSNHVLSRYFGCQQHSVILTDSRCTAYRLRIMATSNRLHNIAKFDKKPPDASGLGYVRA